MERLARLSSSSWYEKLNISLLAAAAALVSFFDFRAQTVTFDSDTAPLHTSLPLDITAVALPLISARVRPFTIIPSNEPTFWVSRRLDFPAIASYPNTVFQSDLLISFGSTLLTDISIMYAPEEYATDSSCMMRLTAYLDRCLSAQPLSD